MRTSILRHALLLATALLSGCSSTAHDWPTECPSPNNNRVWYFHATWEARDQCAYVDAICPLDTIALYEQFPPIQGQDCGCGCYGPPTNNGPPTGSSPALQASPKQTDATTCPHRHSPFPLHQHQASL